MDWKNLIVMISTVALSANPKTRALAPFIAPAILETEELLKGKPGKEKLANAVALVKLSIRGTNAIKPGTVDESASDRLIASAISVVVEASNVIHRSPATAAAA